MNKDNKKELKLEELEQVNGGDWGTFLENGDIICWKCGKTFSSNNCETSTIGLGCHKRPKYICPYCDSDNYTT